MGKKSIVPTIKAKPGTGLLTTKLPLPLLHPDYQWVEEEAFAEPMDEEEEALAEEAEEFDPEDDGESEEAESGIRDHFSERHEPPEPFEMAEDEEYADDPPFDLDAGPALTFFPMADGAVGYAISEFHTHFEWRLLDNLARFLIERAGDARSEEFARSLRSAGKAFQTLFIDRLLAGGMFEKDGSEERESVKQRKKSPAGIVSQLVHSTILSVLGEHVLASEFFRENKVITRLGRTRASELVAQGLDEKQATKSLMEETGSPRTTVIGWVRWAVERSANGPNEGDEA